MKIRTATDLTDRIAVERIWRIREIATLRDQCNQMSIPENTRRILRRSFVPIVYAHWEGFVKKISHYYLEYIAMQRPILGELSAPFQAMFLWNECAQSVSRGKAISLVQVCSTASSRKDHQILLPYRDVIPTHSNLDSKTLKDICLLLNISYAPFESKALFIDSSLVSRRNHIAHGEFQDIDVADMELLKIEVLYLIDSFRNGVENAASLQSHLNAPKP